jgi:hypothetical protein
MKALFLITFAAGAILSLSGCGDGSSTGSSSSSAPAQNQNSAAANNSNPIKQPIIYAQKKADLAALTEAVRQYNVQEGHYPQTLQDLTPNYIARVPVAPDGYKWNYDASSGSVTLVQP